MKTYVIFDKKTGEILHTHVHTDDLNPTSEEILGIARADRAQEALGVMQVPELQAGDAYQVDVNAGQLIRAEQGKLKGFGGASVQAAGAKPDPRLTKTSYFPVSQKPERY